MLGTAVSGLPVYASDTSGQRVSIEESEAQTKPYIDVTGINTNYVYTGDKIEPDVNKMTVTFYPETGNSKTLTSNDYYVTTDTNVQVGEGSVTVTASGLGKDGANLTVTKKFNITKASPTIKFKDTSKSAVYKKDTFVQLATTDYSIEGLVDTYVAGSPTITYKKGSTALPAGTYPTDAGSYTATVTYAGNDNFNKIEGTIPITISQRDISGETGVSVTLDAASFTYNGKAHTPTPTVVVDGVTLTKDTDYTVEYRSNTAVGTGYVDIKGKGNYTGTHSASFTISKTALDAADISSNITVEGLNASGYAYTGSEIKPDKIDKITVKYNGTTLVLNRDYTISYDNNIEPGSSAQLIINGIGSYKNQYKKSFTINAADLDGVTISAIPNQTYTGDAIEPELTVKKGSLTLKKDVDYTVAYSGNTNVGTAKAILTGKNTSFKGSKEIKFNIVAKQITANDVTLDHDSMKYTGANLYPVPTVTVRLTRSNTHTLTSSEYSVSYKNNISVGTGTVIVTGKGNYTGTVNKNFQITSADGDINISSAKFGTISDQTYTGSEIKPSVSVTLNGKSLSSSNYTVSYMNNINAGTGTVVITGKGTYGGSAQTNFKIKPRDISAVSVTGLTAQKYTGFAVQPNLTLTYNGKTLRKGTDYTLTFTNNANIGNGNAIINGLGNFTGTVTKTFPIREMKDGEEVKTYATAITVPETLDATAGNNVTITPSVTAPEDANMYKVRWSTSNPAFVFVDGNNTNTAETTDGTPAVVKAASEGSTVIKAELISDDGNVAGTYYTFIKATKSFSDVSTSSYYSTAVDALANYGYKKGSGASQVWTATPVVNGTTSTSYNPAGPVSRGQFVTMMYNKAKADYAAGKTSVDPSKAAAAGFTDVDSASYYAAAVNWATANGITNGKSSSIFDPDGTVTRAEAVTFLQRWLGGTDGSSSQFTDVAGKSYYAGAVGWAVKSGVTNGTTATTFSPIQNCSRAQAATFIYRAAF